MRVALGGAGTFMSLPPIRALPVLARNIIYFTEITMKILSGIQPSGELHIGNYFGMIKRMVENQERGELYAFIVNYHAMTSVTDGKTLKENTINAAVNMLSLGIDPQKAIFWAQSDLPEVLELYWILSNFTPMGLLERAHSYKDKTARGIAANHGLFSYPVLMAADILLFNADLVPVGKDQIQHVEITEILRKSLTTNTARYSNYQRLV